MHESDVESDIDSEFEPFISGESHLLTVIIKSPGHDLSLSETRQTYLVQDFKVY